MGDKEKNIIQGKEKCPEKLSKEKLDGLLSLKEEFGIDLDFLSKKYDKTNKKVVSPKPVRKMISITTKLMILIQTETTNLEPKIIKITVHLPKILKNRLILIKIQAKIMIKQKLVT